MKNKHSIGIIKFGIISAALLAGCSDQAESPSPGSNVIRISAAVEPQAKATDVAFQVGDRFGLYVVERQGTAPGDLSGPRYLDNIPCLQTENGIEMEPKSYPDSRVDLYAYYPYLQQGASAGSNSLAFSVRASQNEAQAFTLSDLMYASSADVSASGNAVPLLFKHSLARVDIRLKTGAGFDGPAQLAGAVLTAKALPSRCSLNLETGEVRGADIPVDIIPKGSGLTVNGEEASVMSMILIPQTVSAGQELFEIEASGTTFVYVQPTERALAPGSRTLFEITLDRASVQTCARITALE